MNLGPERLSFVFALVGLSLLSCFLFSPWREKQFEDLVAISSNPVDVGQVLCFEKAHGEITLTNLSNIQIPFKANADCSCTTLATTSGVIEPKTKQVLQFTYSPKSFAKLDSSIQQESSDVVVSILNKGVKLSKLVGIKAQGVFPLTIDPSALSNSVEPFRASEIMVPFSTGKDVQNVRLVSAPLFLTESRIDGAGDSSTFRARIEMPSGIHKGPLVLEFEVRNINKVVRIELPFSAVVEKPYEFSTEVLALEPNSECMINVRPKFGAARSTFIAVKSECPQVTTQISEAASNSIRVVCSPSNEAQLPLTGSLRVIVRSEDPAGRELTLEGDIPYVISEGGLSDM